MKRGGPLPRRTGLTRTGSHTRTGLRTDTTVDRNTPRPNRTGCPVGLWDQLVAAAGNRCQRCPCRLGAIRAGCDCQGRLSLSHVVPAGKGGPWAPFNLRVLCGSGSTGSHGWVEANPAAAEAEGWRVLGYFVRGVYVGPDDRYRALAAANLSGQPPAVV